MLQSQKIENFTHEFAKWAGTSSGFFAGLTSILVWFIAGGYYQFSDEWCWGISIYIGVINFLIIFLMQRAQNKNALALHLKLNELIVATNDADNHMIKAEQLTEQEIVKIHKNHLEIEKQN